MAHEHLITLFLVFYYTCCCSISTLMTDRLNIMIAILHIDHVGKMLD